MSRLSSKPSPSLPTDIVNDAHTIDSQLTVSCFSSSLSAIRGGPKNVALHFCPYFRQLLTDFQNSFTGMLCIQFAIMLLLYIPPHGKCVSTLPCEI